MTPWTQCELCDVVGMPSEIIARLVEWTEPAEHKGLRYEARLRCRDSQACRDRFEVGGKVWPIVDRTHPTRPVAVKVVGQPIAVGAGQP